MDNQPNKIQSNHRFQKRNGSGTSSSSSSSSSYPPNLPDKTNDSMTSPPAEQSEMFRYLHQVMRATVAAISKQVGWDTTSLSALDVLTDLTVRHLLQVAKQIKKYADHSGKFVISSEDIELGFKDMNVSIRELIQYVRDFDQLRLPHEVPYFPTPQKSNFNIPPPGSAELLTRPEHVHEYLPPFGSAELQTRPEHVHECLPPFGSAELQTRPEHVQEYLPPVSGEQVKQDIREQNKVDERKLLPAMPGLDAMWKDPKIAKVKKEKHLLLPAVPHLDVMWKEPKIVKVKKEKHRKKRARYEDPSHVPAVAEDNHQPAGNEAENAGNIVWHCPKCHQPDDGNSMVACDICDDWYHFHCVGIFEDPPEFESWFCQGCLDKSAKQKSKGKQKKRKRN